MLSVQFYEVFKEEAAALRRFLPQGIKAHFTSKTVQESGDKNPPAPFISVRTQSVIPPAWARHLSGILTRSTGYDHLLAYHRDYGVPCSSLPEYCSRAVAEQAILLVMALARKLPLQMRNFKKFRRDDVTGSELAGKNCSVVGVGRIGQEVVDLARGLRMNVAGVDLNPGIQDISYLSLSAGLRWAQVVVCCLPLTDKTRDLLNYAALRQARRETIFVNVGRGEVAPLKDLGRLLDEGRLCGVGLDVYEKEQQLSDALRGGKASPAVKVIQRLQKRSDVIFTPHNAFNTHESVERKARLSAEAVVSFLKGDGFPCPLPRLKSHG